MEHLLRINGMLWMEMKHLGSLIDKFSLRGFCKWSAIIMSGKILNEPNCVEIVQMNCVKDCQPIPTCDHNVRENLKWTKLCANSTNEGCQTDILKQKIFLLIDRKESSRNIQLLSFIKECYVWKQQCCARTIKLKKNL